MSVSEVRPPELRFGSCSTIGTPDCGSRTSRQMSPLALSYRTLAVMPFNKFGLAVFPMSGPVRTNARARRCVFDVGRF